MSHFSVLVITEAEPTDELLAEVLAPFDEDGDWNKEGSKWDWWQVGGRFSGLLVPDYEPSADPANRQVCTLCNGTGKREKKQGMIGQEPVGTILKCNSCDGTGIEVKWPTQWSDVGNRLQVKNLPLAKLQEEARQRAAESWDKMHAATAGETWRSWEDIRTAFTTAGRKIDEARTEYHAQPAVVAMKNAGFDSWTGYDHLLASREDFVQSASDGAIATFAVLKDGKWYENGKMGWWGLVSNEKDKGEWHREFAKLLAGLSPETWLTVVDCHV